MSLLHRLYNLLRSSTRYIGKDLEGNKFYEHPSISSDPRRTKRTVKYGSPEGAWPYIGGGKRLPVQWSMWLTHTRMHPPTLEELQQDLGRQQRVLANAAMIEARDEEERKARLRLEQSIVDENAKRARIEQPQLELGPGTQQETQKKDDPLAKSPSPSATPMDELQPWSPRAVRREG